jgi:hypothetical protein
MLAIAIGAIHTRAHAHAHARAHARARARARLAVVANSAHLPI